QSDRVVVQDNILSSPETVIDMQDELDLPPPPLMDPIDNDAVNALIKGFNFDDLEVPLPEVVPVDAVASDKAVDTLLDDFNIDMDEALPESTTAELIDTAVVDELLNVISQEAPVKTLMDPPPLPAKSMAQWQAEKAQQAKQMPSSVLTTEASDPTTVTTTKPKNFHVDKPVFQIQAADFVLQLQKIKENKGKKATEEVTEQKAVPVVEENGAMSMLDIFMGAIKKTEEKNKLNNSTHSIDADEGSLDEWALDDLRADNKFLIRQQANVVARGLDVQAKVNHLLEGKADALAHLVDSYAEKAKGLSIISKLNTEAQENAALNDTVTDGIN
ncbi:MAG TPA: hypothetical protein PLD88_08305, partial [Candidatus Berkiella sp.]|nr:hypothetical protein [Candidatus Berkiella sp.]